MKLRVFTPVQTFLETEISKIDFEALDGFFTLLPKHVDFASAMPPNILHFKTLDGQTKYMACNRGIVVKKGDEVSLSVHKAVLSDSLQSLSRTIEVEFKQDDEERKRLIGEHTKTTYKIGDKIRIRVKDASKLLRTVDFERIERD